MTPPPRLLCVDDEPAVVDGLSRLLRGAFSVTRATSGAAGLEIMRSDPPFAVVMSDMRMPGMDGAAFLAAARDCDPDATRVLLTGQAELDAAIAAVNHGGVFRFLTKPCAQEDLVIALSAAVEQNRLVRSERELLEQTLRGAVDALLEVLSLANPLAFARGARVRRFVSEVATAMRLSDRWALDVAAALAQIGSVTLPTKLTEKLNRGEPLSPAERIAAERVPGVVDELLATIPRLEPVREIIRRASVNFGSGEAIPLGARLLRIANDVDSWESRGMTRVEALARLDGASAYDPELLRVVTAVMTAAAACTSEETLVTINHLTTGMLLTADVYDAKGVLLVGRGLLVTDHIRERLWNLRERIRDPFHVSVQVAAPGAERVAASV